MKVLIPYSGGSHYRSLGLWVQPELEKRGHEVKVVSPTNTHQKTIGGELEWADLLATTSPWWDYVAMWVSAAMHYGKPWVLHPEGWDNIHPVLHEPGHEKNQIWPFKPEWFCAHGSAMLRALKRRRMFEVLEGDQYFQATGGPRFDIYNKYWNEITRSDLNPYFTKFEVPDDGKPVIMVSTAALWDHHRVIQKLLEHKDQWHIVVSQHQCDHVEMYMDTMQKGATIIIPESCNPDDPGRDHGYMPSIQDSLDYARQLYHADVVVNMAGTAGLEAMILNTPVVNVRTPGPTGSEQEFSKSMSHYMPGAHYSDVRAGETSGLAETPEDVPALVNEFITNGLTDERSAAIWTMLEDILSIIPVGHDGEGNIVPSGNATSNICDVIERAYVP